MRSSNNMSCWRTDDCRREKDIANAEREIANLKDRISGAQAEVAILTDVKNKTTNMTETIDVAITALQNISNQWYTVGQNIITYYKT